MKVYVLTQTMWSWDGEPEMTNVLGVFETRGQADWISDANPPLLNHGENRIVEVRMNQFSPHWDFKR